VGIADPVGDRNPASIAAAAALQHYFLMERTAAVRAARVREKDLLATGTNAKMA
jgi:hypothetical protein